MLLIPEYNAENGIILVKNANNRNTDEEFLQPICYLINNQEYYWL